MGDKTVVTSVRYLSRDKKNALVNIITKLCAKYELVEEGERFDPDTNIAKMVFIVCNLIYCLVAITYTNFLYTSYITSCLYFVAIFGIGVWNGASYYIEIFSKR